ncbi:MAG TPA: dTMP kinase [Desulfomonilia bacterium]
MIITFEGGEGSGKTTQAALLKEYLEKQGRQVVSLREPGGSNLSEYIRKLFLAHPMDSMTELMLLLAARRNNISSVIMPALDAGKTVVIDRFIDSTLVYQGIAGGLGIENVRNLMKMTGTLIEPDLTFLLDIDPAIAYSRFMPADRLETRGIETQKIIRQGFLDICRGKRHHVIDAEKPEEKVFEEIEKVIPPDFIT